MYLLRSLSTSIFVVEIISQRKLRCIISSFAVFLFAGSTSFGQQVWPGDINNNGIVNNIDILYWAIANGARGTDRPNASKNWEAQDLPMTVWADTFPSGLNYAYADCNGDGRVNRADRKIIENNFGFVHGELVPDEYATGADSDTNPVLLFSSEDQQVSPGKTFRPDLSLGDKTNQVSDFFGIAFTIVYNPEVVGNKKNDFQLNLLEESWLGEFEEDDDDDDDDDNDIIKFINNDPELGVAQVAIVRVKKGPVSGFGRIGSFKIVMEDIVFLNSSVANTDIKLVNDELADAVVAPSEVIFSVDDGSATSTLRRIKQKGIKVYPNPVRGDQVAVELDNPEEKVRIVQMFDINGRLLSNQKFGGLQNKEMIDVGAHPAGIYTFKIVTDKHFYVQSFYKQP